MTACTVTIKLSRSRESASKSGGGSHYGLVGQSPKICLGKSLNNRNPVIEMTHQSEESDTSLASGRLPYPKRRRESLRRNEKRELLRSASDSHISFEPPTGRRNPRTQEQDRVKRQRSQSLASDSSYPNWLSEEEHYAESSFSDFSQNQSAKRIKERGNNRRTSSRERDSRIGCQRNDKRHSDKKTSAGYNKKINTTKNRRSNSECREIKTNNCKYICTKIDDRKNERKNNANCTQRKTKTKDGDRKMTSRNNPREVRGREKNRMCCSSLASDGDDEDCRNEGINRRTQDTRINRKGKTKNMNEEESVDYEQDAKINSRKKGKTKNMNETDEDSVDSEQEAKINNRKKVKSKNMNETDEESEDYGQDAKINSRKKGKTKNMNENDEEFEDYGQDAKINSRKKGKTKNMNGSDEDVDYRQDAKINSRKKGKTKNMNETDEESVDYEQDAKINSRKKGRTKDKPEIDEDSDDYAYDAKPDSRKKGKTMNMNETDEESVDDLSSIKRKAKERKSRNKEKTKKYICRCCTPIQSD